MEVLKEDLQFADDCCPTSVQEAKIEVRFCENLNMHLSDSKSRSSMARHGVRIRESVRISEGESANLATHTLLRLSYYLRKC